MAAGSFFEATLDGRPPMALDLHRAEITLHRGDGPGFKASGALTATQPGMTLDDRGVEGWDSPIELAFDLGDLGAPDARGGFATTPGDLASMTPGGEAFFFYWDHAQYAALDWTLTAPGGGKFGLELSCASSKGDQVRCATPLIDISVSLAKVSDGDEALVERIVGRPLGSLKVKQRPGCALDARHRQPLL